MVYIKVLCGIGNFSGDPFIHFQPAVYNIKKIDIWPQNKTERISIYMREQLIDME